MAFSGDSEAMDKQPGQRQCDGPTTSRLFPRSRSPAPAHARLQEILMRGNLIDIAVAVVVGVAFNAVVQALVADVVTPLIATVGEKLTLPR